MYSKLLILIVSVICILNANGMPVSPCPRIFQYRYDGHEWSGNLIVQNVDNSQTLHIKVMLSARGKPISNYLGEIELLTRGQYSNREPVLYKIKFPDGRVPLKVLQIQANNIIICNGPKDNEVMFTTKITLEHTRKLSFIPADLPIPIRPDQIFPTTRMGIDNPHEQQNAPVFNMPQSHVMHSGDRDICGQINPNVDVIQKLTLNEFSSTNLHRGAWPWLAAIYANNLNALEFNCIGTLISNRVVITAAHCFHMFGENSTGDDVLVFLGRHNLKNWNEDDSVAAPVDRIFVHPDFNSGLYNYDADIAVIMLKNEVRFNNFIRPACLWSGATEPDRIVGELGVVAGWGQSMAHLTSATKSLTPRAMIAPVVSDEECFRANPDFESISSERTICAGILSDTNSTTTDSEKSIKDSNSPCNGDSGAGLLILKNNRWTLRGLVSATIPKNMSTAHISDLCHSNSYIVYTDVAQFLNWVFAFII